MTPPVEKYHNPGITTTKTKSRLLRDLQKVPLETIVLAAQAVLAIVAVWLLAFGGGR